MESRLEVVEDVVKLSALGVGVDRDIAGGIGGVSASIALDIEVGIGITLWEDVKLVVLVNVS